MSGRIRSIKPEWLEDDLMASSSDEARVLSVALVLMADDYGRGRASLATIATTTWRHEFERDNGAHAPETLARASRALRELVEIRFVKLYEVDRQRYFEIRNWSKHQKVDKPSKPRIPEPISEETPDISDTRETLARPSRVFSETLAPDLDQDQDQDQDHSRRPLADPPDVSGEFELRPDPKPNPVRELFEHWRSVMGKSSATKLDNARRRRCEWAIREYGLEAARLAIDGCSRSDWHMGRDPRSNGEKYNDLTLIFRDAAHLEKFRDLAARPSSGRVEPLPNDAYKGTSQAEIDEMLGTRPGDVEAYERNAKKGFFYG